MTKFDTINAQTRAPVGKRAYYVHLNQLFVWVENTVKEIDVTKRRLHHTSCSIQVKLKPKSFFVRVHSHKFTLDKKAP